MLYAFGGREKDGSLDLRRISEKTFIIISKIVNCFFFLLVMKYLFLVNEKKTGEKI